MPDDRALPNLKARLTIDTSDTQRAEAAVKQARTGIQAMIADAQAGSAAARQAADAAGQAAIAARAIPSGVGQVSVVATGATTKLQGLASAANVLGGSLGGAAGEAGGFASALGAAGVGAGIGFAVLKLKDFGESLNHTKLSLQELRDLGTKSSAQDLIGSTVTAFTFGDINSQLKDLTSTGATGVGTLLNLRDAYAAAGRPTEAFDKALDSARQAQINLTGATERGKAEMDSWTGGAQAAKDAADRLAEASRQLEQTTSNQASAGASLLTSQSSVLSAENRLREAKERLANFGTQATGKSVREQRDEAAAVESAAQRIVDAQQHIIDARQKVADAQEALAHAGEHEALDVNDAQDAVDAAQRKLNASTPEERGPAQHALDDARQKLVDAKRALDDAKPDAERALSAAVRDVADAERGASDAHRALIDAQDKVNESADKAAKSQGDYQSAVDAVTEAQLGLAAAQASQMDLLAQLAGRVDGPVSKLGNLKAALRGVADELDPNSELTQRVLYVLAALGGVEIPQLKIVKPGEFRTSARGGHLSAFEPSWVGDKFGLDRAELFVPDVPGTVVPQLPGGGFGYNGPQQVTNHHNETHVHVANPDEPLARAIRRELDRREMLGPGG